MAYSDLLDRDNINSQYLAVMVPRRKLDDAWTNLTSTLFVIDFDFGFVSRLDLDNTELTKASDANLSDGVWFYDDAAKAIYYDTGSDPSGEFITAHYELYVGTFDASFNRVPTDAASQVVYYEPLIVKSPQILQNLSDVLFGFLPTQTSAIVLSSVTGFFLKHLSDSSFNQAPVKVYHYLDKLRTENVKEVVDGVCGNIKYTDDTISLTVYDSNQIFDEFYRNANGETFFSTSDFPNVDPNYIAKPIRSVFGLVEGFVPVNVDYEFDFPSVTNNRKWVCFSGDTFFSTVATNVAPTPASTSTVTYLVSVDGINAGDTLYKQGSGGPSTDEYILVQSVNKASNFVTHATITNTGASGEVVERANVSRVTVIQDGVTYVARYKRDYDTFNDVPTASSGFTFVDDFEANLSIPRPLSPSDTVFCTIYAAFGGLTFNSQPFGSISPSTENCTNPIPIILSLLVDNLGVPEDKINITSFEDLDATITGEMGFAIPRFSTDQPKKYRDIIGDILQSELLKISFDDDNKIQIKQTSPLPGTADKTAADDEILANSIKFEYTYTDMISDAIVAYSGSEVNSRGEVVAELSVQTVTRKSEIAEKLHKVKKQKTLKSLHIFKADAEDLASRIRYALGDRRGVARFQVKNRFFNTEIDDRIDIVRDKVPGFAYDRGVNRTLPGAVISSTKSLTDITIEIDDQKGIQDNSGSW